MGLRRPTAKAISRSMRAFRENAKDEATGLFCSVGRVPLTSAKAPDRVRVGSPSHAPTRRGAVPLELLHGEERLQGDTFGTEHVRTPTLPVDHAQCVPHQCTLVTEVLGGEHNLAARGDDVLN